MLGGCLALTSTHLLRFIFLFRLFLLLLNVCVRVLTSVFQHVQMNTNGFSGIASAASAPSWNVLCC